MAVAVDVDMLPWVMSCSIFGFWGTTLHNIAHSIHGLHCGAPLWNDVIRDQDAQTQTGIRNTAARLVVSANPSSLPKTWPANTALA